MDSAEEWWYAPRVTSSPSMSSVTAYRVAPQAVLVLSVLEAVDRDVGLHLKVGDRDVKAFESVAAEAGKLFQVFGQGRPSLSSTSIMRFFLYPARLSSQRASKL